MNNNTTLIIIITLVILILLAIIFIWPRFYGDDFNLSRSGETIETTVVVEKNGEKIQKEIMITDGVKHSVPLKEIVGGGPSKDGIPSIDNPKFISFKESDKLLTGEEPGISIDIDGVQRFYPFAILVWHEIVNDNINGKRILVTYCPLCLSGIVFDPLVLGERVEFGTSGKLWNSNLVMYDRKTDSLWSQILGEAIAGEETGVKLTILPSEQIRYKNFKNIYPNGEVLSQDTGIFKPYGDDPYEGYYTSSTIISRVNNTDDRLDVKDIVMGIVINGDKKAYWVEAVKRDEKIEEEVGEKNIIVEYNKEFEAVQIFEKKEDGSRGKINAIPNFWFAWVAVHPGTEVYK